MKITEWKINSKYRKGFNRGDNPGEEPGSFLVTQECESCRNHPVWDPKFRKFIRVSVENRDVCRSLVDIESIRFGETRRGKVSRIDENERLVERGEGE